MPLDLGQDLRRAGHRAAVHRGDDVERRETAAGRAARTGLAVFHQGEARRDAAHAQPAIAEGDHRDERDEADERPAERPLDATSAPLRSSAGSAPVPRRGEGRRQTRVEIPVDAVALAIPGGRRGRGLVQYGAGLRARARPPSPRGRPRRRPPAPRRARCRGRRPGACATARPSTSATIWRQRALRAPPSMMRTPAIRCPPASSTSTWWRNP